MFRENHCKIQTNKNNHNSYRFSDFNLGFVVVVYFVMLSIPFSIPVSVRDLCSVLNRSLSRPRTVIYLFIYLDGPCDVLII